VQESTPNQVHFGRLRFPLVNPNFRGQPSYPRPRNRPRAPRFLQGIARRYHRCESLGSPPLRLPRARDSRRVRMPHRTLLATIPGPPLAICNAKNDFYC